MTQPVPTESLTARAAAAVRETAAQARWPSVITISHHDGRISADLTSLDAGDVARYGARTLLGALGEVMARYPDLDLYRQVHGYALVLPDAQVAYLLDIHGTASTIVLGPNARDDAHTRADAINGLAAMVDAATRPGHGRPGPGTAFTPLDRISATARPTIEGDPAAPPVARHRRSR